LRLGVLTLEKGRGQLTLRAFQISGKKVMDVRAVLLTLQNKGRQHPYGPWVRWSIPWFRSQSTQRSVQEE
jgi:hypothetical protein